LKGVVEKVDVPIEELRNRIGNVYELVIVAAKRTRQINEGAPKLVDVKCARATTVAMWEIAKGKIGYRVKNEKAEG
jgi:DNA-directed RNA polymerase subunit omega